MGSRSSPGGTLSFYPRIWSILGLAPRTTSSLLRTRSLNTGVFLVVAETERSCWAEGASPVSNCRTENKGDDGVSCFGRWGQVLQQQTSSIVGAASGLCAVLFDRHGMIMIPVLGCGGHRCLHQHPPIQSFGTSSPLD